MNLPIVLASSSPYRQQILKRLNISFTTTSPNIDETPLPSESAGDLVVRLATSKTKAVKQQFSQHLIIGCDQIVSLNGKLIGKPKNHQDAVNQLQCCSNKVVTIYTAIALLNSQTSRMQTAIDYYHVEYKRLDIATIERYLLLEKPYDCCGSLKAEGIGISLLSRLTGNDPNSLIGLPIIQLLSMFEKENMDIFSIR